MVCYSLEAVYKSKARSIFYLASSTTSAHPHSLHPTTSIMKSFAAITLLCAALAEVAHGHYIFQYLTANGVKGAQYQNVRKNTNNNSPVTDLASNDLRCNVGGGSGASTTTVSVAAGSSVTLTADIAVYHQGPVSFYLSKVSSASGADGSADWVKIKEIGPTFSGGQATWDLKGTFVYWDPPQGDPRNLLISTKTTTPLLFPLALLLVNICSALSSSASTTPAPHHSSTSLALRSRYVTQ